MAREKAKKAKKENVKTADAGAFFDDIAKKSDNDGGITKNNDNESETAAVTRPANEPEPNIKFIGKTYYTPGKRKVLRTDAPVTKIFGTGIELPNASDQKRARKFYHPDAKKIVRLFPHLYKNLVKKGK